MLTNEVLRVINKRRSVRAYKETSLTQEEMEAIIHAAMIAPTAGNMMHFSIIEVKDQSKKDKLVKTCDNQPLIAKAPLVLLFLSDLQRIYDYYEASGVGRYIEKENLEYKTPQESDLMLASCDAVIAAQNAVIAAESMGIGSVYIGDIMENFEIHREMFNLPRWTFPIALLCFGYPKTTGENAKRTERIQKKYIHFVDSYEKLGKEDILNVFSHMEPHPPIATYPKNAENLGQAMYARKTGSDFSKEMERSVKVAIKRWCDG